MNDTVLKKAIEAAGGPKALGELLGISSQAISQWDECPPRRVIEVSRASKISPHALRPDLYPLDVHPELPLSDSDLARAG